MFTPIIPSSLTYNKVYVVHVFVFQKCLAQKRLNIYRPGFALALFSGHLFQRNVSTKWLGIVFLRHPSEGQIFSTGKSAKKSQIKINTKLIGQLCRGLGA